MYVYMHIATHIATFIAMLQVKVRKQFPLTSIVNIIYKEKEYPCAFILEFQKSEILLEAHDERDCKLWVKTITKGA